MEKLKAGGLHCIQLALDPIRSGAWNETEIVSRLREANVEIASGMMGMKGEDYSTLDSIRRTGGVRPDAHWADNLAAASANAALADRLGIRLVTFHAGFIPHNAMDPLRARMLERLHAVVDRFAEHGVQVAFETGQETAETLLAALEALGHPEVGVNFDPANMILYGMGDPFEALHLLAPRILQIHVKDALPAKTPGTWGEEVRAGDGAVAWPRLLQRARELDVECDLMIEREAGASRLNDIAVARELIRSAG
jgi:L-ribulose-5-phosphate 3-epimerase